MTQADWAEDQVITFTEVHLDWTDRLKVLLGRPLHVDVHTDVEHAPGRHQSVSKVWVQRFVWPWTHPTGGYAETPQR